MGNPAGNTCLPLEPYSSLEHLLLCADQEVLVDMPLCGLMCFWPCVMKTEQHLRVNLERSMGQLKLLENLSAVEQEPGPKWGLLDLNPALQKTLGCWYFLVCRKGLRSMAELGAVTPVSI